MEPNNPISGTVYQGKNVAILLGACDDLGYTKPEFVTYCQARDNGGQVRKGEKGIRCIKMVNFEDKKTKKKSSRPTGFTVFNVSQVDWDGEPSTEPQEPIIAKTAPKRVDLSGKLRELAGKMQATIDGKFADRQTNTAKRLAQARHSQLDGEKLIRVQKVLRALGDLHETGEVPEILAKFKSKAAILEHMGEKKEPVSNGYHCYYTGLGVPSYDDAETLALWALLKPESEESKQKKELQSKIDGLQFSNIPGYFPTPKAVTELMIDHAELMSYNRILEPSAGAGAIIDALQGRSLEVHYFETQYTLCEILAGKGYKGTHNDFLNVEPTEDYDCVLMNPPFENLQHIDHIHHAYKFLGELGRLVAVLPPLNSTKKCTEFLAWIESIGGEFVQLPEGSFKESGTMVNTQLLILDK